MTTSSPQALAHNIPIKRCLETFETKFVDPVSLEPLSKSRVIDCGHSFKKTPQIVEWLRDKGTCPVCRSKVTQSMPKNYHANELYATAREMACEIDKLSTCISNLEVAHKETKEKAAVSDMNKDLEIEALKKKAESVFNECERLKSYNKETGYAPVANSDRFLEEVQKNSVLTLENGVLVIEKRKLEETIQNKDKEIIVLKAENKALGERIKVLENSGGSIKPSVVFSKVSQQSKCSDSSKKKKKKKKKKIAKHQNECPVTKLANAVVGTAYEYMPCLEKVFS